MKHMLLIAWKTVLMLGLAIGLLCVSIDVVLADILDDNKNPPLVANASQEELDDLLSILQPRIEQSLRALPDSVKESLTQSVQPPISSDSDPLLGVIPLRGVWFDQEKRLVIDFAGEARLLGIKAFEVIGDYTISLVNEELNKRGYSSDRMSYYFEIEGLGVEQIFRLLPTAQSINNQEGESTNPNPREELPTQQPPTGSTTTYELTIGISGHRIAINPGHGYYDAGSGTWAYSGTNWWFVQEDNLNVDMAIKLKQALESVGTAVVPLRELERDPLFDSTHKWWEMGSREYARGRLNQPAQVWNYGSDNRARDLNTRFLLASALNAEVLVSVLGTRHGLTEERTGAICQIDGVAAWLGPS